MPCHVYAAVSRGGFFSDGTDESEGSVGAALQVREYGSRENEDVPESCACTHKGAARSV